MTSEWGNGDEVLPKTDELAQPLIKKGGSILWNPRTEYKTRYHYQGEVKAVILDWAGTVIDSGVFGPVVVFLELFANEGVPITIDEARGPMGIHKKDHLRKITEMEGVRSRWFDKWGRYPDESDVDRMFQNAVPMQLACLSKYSTMINGAVDTVTTLQQTMNLKVGTTTGYTRDMLEVIKPLAVEQGYKPDSYVAADEVPQARPYPYMVWLNLIRMNVNPIQAVVKVDDTADGVREGITAGCWSVGLARTGNYVGLTEEEISALSPEDYERRLKRSYSLLVDAGAHYVIDTINDMPHVIRDINRRLAAGEHP